MTRIVRYVHRPKRLPRKQATAAAIVTATNKRDTIIRRRKEATDDGCGGRPGRMELLTGIGGVASRPLRRIVLMG
jgi:hypothetical protein